MVSTLRSGTDPDSAARRRFRAGLGAAVRSRSGSATTPSDALRVHLGAVGPPLGVDGGRAQDRAVGPITTTREGPSATTSPGGGQRTAAGRQDDRCASATTPPQPPPPRRGSCPIPPAPSDAAAPEPGRVCDAAPNRPLGPRASPIARAKSRRCRTGLADLWPAPWRRPAEPRQVGTVDGRQGRR